MHPISSKIPTILRNGPLLPFSCRERNNNLISELIKNVNIGLYEHYTEHRRITKFNGAL